MLIVSVCYIGKCYHALGVREVLKVKDVPAALITGCCLKVQCCGLCRSCWQFALGYYYPRLRV